MEALLLSDFFLVGVGGVIGPRCLFLLPIVIGSSLPLINNNQFLPGRRPGLLLVTPGRQGSQVVGHLVDAIRPTGAAGHV